jgi:hexosaminidase
MTTGMKSTSVCLALLFTFAQTFGQEPPLLPLIPLPVSVVRTGDYFTVSSETAIRALDRSLEDEAVALARSIGQQNGVPVKIIIGGVPADNNIVLEPVVDSLLGTEGYRLSVTQRRIILRGTGAGIYYGGQTIRQLLPAGVGKEIRIPGVEITDYPRYRWRGMHLDVGRHFFPKEFLKKYIDGLALYKLNTFHLHLTDDQGWRVQIKKYPRLTTVGAFRKGSMIGPYSAQKFDSLLYGGFYTQDEIRELVAYAAKRHVTIVPELEMPGHSLAALASYPELSCTGGPFEVGKAWGVYDDVYCPTEGTFTFLENVLSEICDLFPGRYIHIGGDEVPKTRWKACSHCQNLIKQKGLKDENGLQSYFTRRIETYLNGRGKQIIGWDEILEGGLAPNAAVMSWRGTQGGIAAARQKHLVVMTPGDFCYFDYYQGNPQTEPLAIGGYTTVEKVYSYNPTPTELSPEEQSYILGAQGNVWTEYITSPEQVEYMAFPRIAALAEVVWTPQTARRYGDFRSRLLAHLPLLDSLPVNYSHAIYEVTLRLRSSDDHAGLTVGLETALDSNCIRYTVDGSDPTAQSPAYRAPFQIKEPRTLKATYWENGRRKSPVVEQPFFINLSTGKPVQLAVQADQKYPGHGPATLVDGIRGDTARFGLHWIGFSGSNLNATIDLGAQTTFSKIRTAFFDGEGSWIHLPRHLSLFAGADSSHMTKLMELTAAQIRSAGMSVILDFGRQTARFVRLVAENAGVIPDGKPGAGNPAWLFVDEIAIEE